MKKLESKKKRVIETYMDGNLSREIYTKKVSETNTNIENLINNKKNNTLKVVRPTMST